MEDNIYANAEDLNLQEMQAKGRNPETGPSPFLPSAGPADRCCRWTAVGVGLLCALLLGLSIGLAAWLLTERDQLLTTQNNLLEERDQLLTNQSNLLEERDQLLTNQSNLLNMRVQNCYKSGEKPSCPPGWEVFGCKCYHNDRQPRTWSDSRSYCQSLGGDLVIIKTPEKQWFITNKYYAGWIGLKKGRDGNWRWTDNSPVSTWYWHPEQPKRSGDCVVIHQSYTTNHKTWHDYNCNVLPWHWSLCEMPAYPEKEQRV